MSRLPADLVRPLVVVAALVLASSTSSLVRAQSTQSTRPIQLTLPTSGDSGHVDGLLELLRSDNVSAKRGAIYELGELGPQAPVAVPALRAQLRLADKGGLRVACIDALGRIGAAAAPAIPDIIGSIDDADTRSTHRPILFRALGRIGRDDPNAIAAARRWLPNSEEPESAIAAALALWRMNREPKALAVLEDWVRKQDSLASTDAILALAEIVAAGHDVDLDSIIAALGNPHYDVRITAAHVLMHDIELPLSTLLDHSVVEKFEHREALIVLGRGIQRQRLKVMYAAPQDQNTIVALARQWIGEVLPKLTPLAQSPRAEIRAAAAHAMAETGVVSVPTLLKLIQSNDQATRTFCHEVVALLANSMPADWNSVSAARSLRDLLPSRLTNSLTSQHKQERLLALHLVVLLSFDALPAELEDPLRQALRDDDAEIRRLASQALHRNKVHE